MGHNTEKKIGVVDCRNCRHFQITWDASYPKGCRAMGFKTSQWPWMEVLQTSGEPCLKFQPKPKKTSTWKEEIRDREVPLPPGRFSRMV